MAGIQAVATDEAVVSPSLTRRLHRGGSVTVSTALLQWMYPPRESGWEAEDLDLLNGRRCRAVRPIRWVGR